MKEGKPTLSGRKVMASICWDGEGILLIDYHSKGKTITGKYHAKLLDRRNQSNHDKSIRLCKEKINFHQDNARPRVSMTNFAELEVQLSEPYSLFYQI